MVLKKLSICGFLFGLIWCVSFLWRYWILYQDTSQGTLFVGVGLIIIAISWVYNIVANIVDDLKHQKAVQQSEGEYLRDLKEDFKEWKKSQQ